MNELHLWVDTQSDTVYKTDSHYSFLNKHPELILDSQEMAIFSTFANTYLQAFPPEGLEKTLDESIRKRWVLITIYGKYIGIETPKTKKALYAAQKALMDCNISKGEIIVSATKMILKDIDVKDFLTADKWEDLSSPLSKRAMLIKSYWINTVDGSIYDVKNHNQFVKDNPELFGLKIYPDNDPENYDKILNSLEKILQTWARLSIWGKAIGIQTPNSRRAFNSIQTILFENNISEGSVMASVGKINFDTTVREFLSSNGWSDFLRETSPMGFSTKTDTYLSKRAMTINIYWINVNTGEIYKVKSHKQFVKDNPEIFGIEDMNLEDYFEFQKAMNKVIKTWARLSIWGDNIGIQSPPSRRVFKIIKDLLIENKTKNDNMVRVNAGKIKAFVTAEDFLEASNWEDLIKKDIKFDFANSKIYLSKRAAKLEPGKHWENKLPFDFLPTQKEKPPGFVYDEESEEFGDLYKLEIKEYVELKQSLKILPDGEKRKLYQEFFDKLIQRKSVKKIRKKKTIINKYYFDIKNNIKLIKKISKLNKKLSLFHKLEKIINYPKVDKYKYDISEYETKPKTQLPQSDIDMFLYVADFFHLVRNYNDISPIQIYTFSNGEIKLGKIINAMRRKFDVLYRFLKEKYNSYLTKEEFSQFIERIDKENQVGLKSLKWKLVVSAEPCDLLTMSTERGWKSCITKNRLYYDDLKQSVQENAFDMVAYAVGEDGKWIARVMLRNNGDGKFWPEKVYKVPSSLSEFEFSEKVEDWLRKRNLLGRPGKFHENAQGYSDYEFGEIINKEKAENLLKKLPISQYEYYDIKNQNSNKKTYIIRTENLPGVSKILKNIVEIGKYDEGFFIAFLADKNEILKIEKDLENFIIYEVKKIPYGVYKVKDTFEDSLYYENVLESIYFPSKKGDTLSLPIEFMKELKTETNPENFPEKIGDTFGYKVVEEVNNSAADGFSFPKPKVYIVVGTKSSGKTTLLKNLKNKIPSLLTLDFDEIFKTLKGSQRRSKRFEKIKTSKPINVEKIQQALAQRLLDNRDGCPVVFTSRDPINIKGQKFLLDTPPERCMRRQNNNDGAFEDLEFIINRKKELENLGYKPIHLKKLEKKIVDTIKNPDFTLISAQKIKERK